MPATSVHLPVPALKEQLVRESCSMARRLVTNGVRVPPALIQAADQFESALAKQKPVDMAALASTHERLARLVAPAKPGTLYLLDVGYQQQGEKRASLGPVKLVRDMVRVAMVCVGVFITLSVMALVDAHPTVQIFGRDMVIVEIIMERIFWLSAAGIGASFAMLFQLNDQIVSRTYDPDESASIWVKFFLGLVAGFILVALLPVAGPNGAGDAETSAEALGPPTVALLGGFSASAVYRILTRLVEALESVFAGGIKEQTAAAERSALARSAEETSQGRMAIAGQLVDLQQRMAAGLSTDAAAEQLKQVVASLVPTAYEFQSPSPPPDEAGDGDTARVPAFAVVGAPDDAPADASTDSPESDVPQSAGSAAAG